MGRKQRKKMSTDSTSRGRYGQLPQQQTSLTDNTTVFFLPGVDVKVGSDLVFFTKLMLHMFKMQSIATTSFIYVDWATNVFSWEF